MVDTHSDDLLSRLKTLSKRELQVLVLRCQGMKYVDVGKALFIAESTVKTDIGRIYMKLGLDLFDPSVRVKVLYDTVCPFIKSQKPARETAESIPEEVVDGEVVPEEAEKPIPKKIMDMVENDGKALVPWAPAPLVAPQHPSSKRPIWPVVLVLGVVLGICLGAGGVYLYLRSNGGSNPFIPQPTPALPTTTDIPSETPLPSPTQEIPTQKPLVIVVTATPPPATEAPTSLPAPAVSLPFTDNFDNGPSPSWQILSGNWITADGRFTPIQNNHQSWMWAILDEPSWQNYRVSVNVHVPYPYSAAQGQVALVVRISGSQSKYLGFQIDSFLQGEWAYIGSGFFDEQSISGSSRVGIPDTANIEVDANGNSFIARVNGQQYQQITLTGYPQGGVGLGVLCAADKCPSFDDFKVEPLGP